MAKIKFSDRLILAKIESEYGTDSTPDAALNAIQATNVELTPMNAETADRNLQKPYLGASELMIYGENVTLAFSVELQGSGAAGTAPAFGPLLLASAMAETIDAGVSVSYLPITDDVPSLTFYMYVGNNLHEFNGARGTYTLELRAGIPYLNFTFTGIYKEPVTGVKGTPDYSGFKKPLVTGQGRTMSFSLGAHTPNIHEFTVDIGNTVSFNESLILKAVEVTDRAGAGNIVIDAPEVSEKNYFADAQQSITQAMKLVHGNQAGYIVEVDAPKVQVQNPSYGDQNGITTLAMDLTLVPDIGNDELKLTFK